MDKNSAVLIVHNLGNIVNVPRLKSIRPDLIFVEDNCEGFTGKYENVYSGMSTSTLCSSVSFYANKILTTGEGGAFFTNDDKVYEYIKSIYSHGMTNVRYIHNKLAYNYRMTNVQAAFLYDQLNDLDHILTLKENLFKNYDKLLEKALKEGKIIKLESEENTLSATWMYCIIIHGIDFKNFELYMNEKLIQVRPFFYDIRKHDHLKDIKVDYSEITNSGIMLPSYPGLKGEQQEYIINFLVEYLNTNSTI